MDAAWTLAVDLDRCTGCSACMGACRLENNLPVLPPAPPERRLDWIVLAVLDNGSVFPEADRAFVPGLCLHCADAPCVKACPVGATQRASGQGGLVSQVYARCIGCRACLAACPYRARTFNWVDPAWPGGMGRALSPHVPVRPRGVAEKCSLCAHRLFAARKRARREGVDPAALPEGYYRPACVEACPPGALVFGDGGDPSSLVARLRRDPRAFDRLPALGTRPRVFYLTRRAWLRRRLEGGLS